MSTITSSNPKHRAGFVGVFGRSNVGKSTLVNAILGEKIAITANKPQTTRQQLLGIRNTEEAQIIYVDTPGLQSRPRVQLDRYMNKQSLSSCSMIDVGLFVVEVTGWRRDDSYVLKQLEKRLPNLILVINKIDRLFRMDSLLPVMQDFATYGNFCAIIPISALKKTQISDLENRVVQHLPLHPGYFPNSQSSTNTLSFSIAECIREKVVRCLEDELPYRTAVTIEQLIELEDVIKICATIWVSRAGQKPIVIGKHGAKLKEIGSLARKELVRTYKKKVFLKTWVKVESSWEQRKNFFTKLGFDNHAY